MKTLLSSAALMVALTINAQTGSGSIYIHSSANIYGAGHGTPPAPGGGGAGLPPSSSAFRATTGRVILFTNVSGSISLSSSLGVLNNADGNSSFSTDISSFGGLSGIRSDASGFLVGVFLGPAEPTNPAPTTLDFGVSGLGTSFPSLSPQIGQLFFIGDGLTGTGSGTVQQFFVPATATRFYMGFADAPGYTGLPGQYQDNVGSLIASFRWQTVPETNDPPVAIVTISPLFRLSTHDTNLVVFSPDGVSATVIFDGSLSSDVENDPLEYFWFEEGRTNAFATGVTVTNELPVGEYTVALVVSDGQDTGTNHVSFSVIAPAQAVADLVMLVEQADLGTKNKQPLLATLNAAMRSFDRDKFDVGVNQLYAFENKVRAQIAPFDPATADSFISAAQRIIDAMNGP